MLKPLNLATLCSLAVLAGTAAGASHDSLGCGSCHIAHTPPEAAGTGALWNLKQADDGLPAFQLYSSPAFDALSTDIAQPDGPSKLCLGCHDGSYPGLSGKRGVFSASSLAMTHPVSFTYDGSLARRAQNGALFDPSVTPSGLGGTVAQDLLDHRGKVQCTSCHDVHNSGKGPSMLRLEYNLQSPSGAALCKACHNR
jgi:predicted CXXCH cytochrome family protein